MTTRCWTAVVEFTEMIWWDVRDRNSNEYLGMKRTRESQPGFLTVGVDDNSSESNCSR